MTARDTVETLRNARETLVEVFSDPTPPDPEMEERYRIYRLCECDDCGGTGKKGDVVATDISRATVAQRPRRCPNCRGEGRNLELVATCGTPEAVGVALVTLALEDEFSECPIGLMDRPEGQTGKWLIKPWLPSARNVSDAGRTLALSRHRDIITKED